MPVEEILEARSSALHIDATAGLATACLVVGNRRGGSRGGGGRGVSSSAPQAGGDDRYLVARSLPADSGEQDATTRATTARHGVGPRRRVLDGKRRRLRRTVQPARADARRAADPPRLRRWLLD